MYLDIQNVTYVYRASPDKGGGVTALGGISFGVERGEFVSLLGPSGCGKSTLLRLIDGLTRPTDGRILIDGTEVSGPGPDRAMMFQDFGLMPWRTALANVEMGLEFGGKPKAERERVAREMIGIVGLKGFEKSYPYQLSGGMRQRIGLARALSVSPEMLLMDEPFASVDAQTRELMHEELLSIWQQFKRTVVFVTHSIDEAIVLSDRILVLSARPGTIKLEMEVPLPRPRWVTNVRETKEFVMLRAKAWEVLKQVIQQKPEEGVAE
ncbi:MAG: ABC transporter ATP-binding protein [Dehalococcoidia bacterium]|nr:ABC transporter ATP-binding protein [Dehalococcoidia bacterium]